MQAYFFGAAERQLFASFHPAVVASGSSPGPAVLICGPHGQDAVRAHRLVRVLAERLARSGCDVLRFDPYGCGDSAGDDEELELNGWQTDMVNASAELSRRCPGRKQVWLGLRLGATAACRVLAEPRNASRPGRAGLVDALILIEPVWDGRLYLHDLAVATVQTLEASCSIKNRDWKETLQKSQEQLEREAVGFTLGTVLHAQLRDLAAPALGAPAGCAIHILVPRAQELQSAVAQQWRAQGCRVSIDVQSYDFDWTAEEALNSALVPNELIMRLTQLTLGYASMGSPVVSGA